MIDFHFSLILLYFRFFYDITKNRFTKILFSIDYICTKQKINFLICIKFFYQQTIDQ